MNQGIIYVATGAKYLVEAIKSATSAKKYMPHLPITLFTDSPDFKAPGREAFDQIIRLENPSHNFEDKIRPLKESPYQQTLFLDTDTLILDDCSEIFAPLRRYDMAVCHEYHRIEFDFEKPLECFPVLNTGVICYRKSTAFDQFMNSWVELYKNHYKKINIADQPAFRDALYHSDLTIFVLPNEYNFRPFYPCFVGGFSKVKIVHDHNPYSEEIGRVVNKWSAAGPIIYGPINPMLIGHWYWMKVRKVLRRWLNIN